MSACAEVTFGSPDRFCSAGGSILNLLPSLTDSMILELVTEWQDTSDVLQRTMCTGCLCLWGVRLSRRYRESFETSKPMFTRESVHSIALLLDCTSMTTQAITAIPDAQKMGLTLPKAPHRSNAYT